MIPLPHQQRFAQLAAPYIGDIIVGILGGSQVLGLADQSSDADVLLIGEHIHQPVSLTTIIDGQRYDLILRDPHTLAYDIEHDLQLGRGTLLHICHFGVPVFGDTAKAEKLKSLAKKLYANGPPTIERNSFDDRLDDIHQNIDEACTLSPDALLLQSFMIAHDLGVLALRGNRRWMAKGKILARFLTDHQPDMKQTLDRGTVDLAFHRDPGAFKYLVQHKVPQAYRNDSDRSVPFWVEGHHVEDPADMADAFTCVRTNPKSIPSYLQSDNPLKQEAVKLWLRWRFENAASPITTARMGRVNGEYYYSLFKFLGQLISLDGYQTDIGEERISLATRVSMFVDHYPDAPEYIRVALTKDPDRILNLGKEIYTHVTKDRLSDQPGNLPARLAPAHFRLNTPVF